MALQPLLVFVIMSGQLYILSSDSKSDSGPEESESLKIPWREGGRGLWYFTFVNKLSSRGGGGGQKKCLTSSGGGAKKNVLGKNHGPYSSLNPLNSSSIDGLWHWCLQSWWSGAML